MLVQSSACFDSQTAPPDASARGSDAGNQLDATLPEPHDAGDPEIDGAALDAATHDAALASDASEPEPDSGDGEPDAGDGVVGLYVDREALSFQGINGRPLAAASVHVGSGAAPVTWTASSEASWLVLDRETGVTPSTLVVGIDPGAGGTALASGTYSAVITLSAHHGGALFTAAIGVQLTLTPATLVVEPSELTLLGSRISGDWVSETVRVHLNTGAGAFGWTASSAQEWVDLDPASGVASQEQPASLTIDADDVAPEGEYPSAVVFQATVHGDTITATLPITLERRIHRLTVSDDGVALSSVPGRQLLSATVIVRDNLGLDTAWLAASDQEWLQVTASGVAGGELVLEADPTGLEADTVHYASVELSSDTPSVERADTIRVGLWTGSAVPDDEARIERELSEVVADPIRPYAYAHAGGTDISIYNVYTAELVATLPAVAARLAQLAISSDGSQLFAYDATNFRVVPVDLDTLTTGAPWSVGADGSVPLTYGRLNGGKLLFSGNNRVHDARTGARIDVVLDGDSCCDNIIDVSQDGSRLCALNTGLSPYSVDCYELEYIEADGSLRVLSQATRWGGDGPGGVGSNGTDVAVSPDGTRVYIASGAPYNFHVFDTATFEQLQVLPGDAYPNNIELSDDGRILAGASVAYDPYEIWIYEPTNGLLLDAYEVTGHAKLVLPRQLKMSGDGARAIALTDDPALVFVTTSLP